MEEHKYVQSLATYAELRITYDIDESLLGSGSYGKVFKASDKKDKSMEVAIKTIDKKQLDEEGLEDLKNEVKLM